MKLKDWLLAEKELYEPKLVSSKYLKKHNLFTKSKMYNFMYVDEMKIKIGYITNIFLWL